METFHDIKGTACEIFKWPKKDFKIGFMRSAAYGGCPMSPRSCNVFKSPPPGICGLQAKNVKSLAAFGVQGCQISNFFFFFLICARLTGQRLWSQFSLIRNKCKQENSQICSIYTNIFVHIHKYICHFI